jgi:hypothetical protein
VTSYFRVTVEDLDTGDKQSMEIAEGDYLLIPFGGCYLNHVHRSANGTVQMSVKDHRPLGPVRNRLAENAQGQVVEL